MAITIYHNPRCSKSRQTLEILERSGVQFRVIEYLNEPLGGAEIKSLLKKLRLSASDLVRRKEAIFKEAGLENADEQALVAAMATHPILIERPIVENDGRAIIGRPPENVNALL
ncbi:MAG: arsenate reductase (glutaredoxin) [Pseudomonadota bacterium]